MIFRTTLVAPAALLAAVGSVGVPPGAARADDAPPLDSQPLSVLLPLVEQRSDFLYIDEIEWEDGAYEVEYVTRDGGREHLEIDPVSGRIDD